jgi:hypothetical protein
MIVLQIRGRLLTANPEPSLEIGRCRDLTENIRKDEEKVQTTNYKGDESHSGKHNALVVRSNRSGSSLNF